MKTKIISRTRISDHEGPGDYPADGAYSESKVYELTDGAGSGKANLTFADVRTLGGGASEDLDLAGGLTDQFGRALTFTHVKQLRVLAPVTNAEDVVVGGAAANQFVGPFGAVTHTVAVVPGGEVNLVHPTTGWGVTAATADQLKILAGASGGDYTIVIVGEGTAV